MRKVNGKAIPICDKNHNAIDNKSVMLIWQRYEEMLLSNAKQVLKQQQQKNQKRSHVPK